jgi:hypothetical protein
MNRRARRQVEPLGLSFLDAIFCGFGAVILLFVIVRGAQPDLIERDAAELRAEIEILTEESRTLGREATELDRELATRRAALADAEQQVARFESELTEVQGRFEAARDTATVQNRLTDRLARAQQELSEEMRRLLAQRRQAPSDRLVGGIPVDSEYIVFIIDTSGSMQTQAWSLLQRKVEETLRLYPRVKGIQVMNDMGHYMFSQYEGKWIPDSPARRRAIVERLERWRPFSNSSPVEGIERAIRSFYRPDRKISLYVLGDEFSGPSIDKVVATVDRLNRADAEGNRRVRIHGVGFPVMFTQAARSSVTGERFATLMRELAHRNGGTFVGLSSVR